MKDKIISWAVVGVLTIAWISVSITDEDIEKQYKENTWKELTISENDLVSYDEVIESYVEVKTDMQKNLDSLDCVNYEYDFFDSCSSVELSIQEYIKSIDNSITCFTKVNQSYDLEKSDLTYCVDAMKGEKLAILDFFKKASWACDVDCENEIEVSDYNLAMFQAYLNNIE